MIITELLNFILLNQKLEIVACYFNTIIWNIWDHDSIAWHHYLLWCDTHTAGALWWPSGLPLLFDVSVKVCRYQAWWDGLWLEWFQVCEAAFSVCIWSLQANDSYPCVPDRLRWARTELDLTGHSINLHHRPLCSHLWSPFPLYVSFSISPFPLDSLSHAHLPYGSLSSLPPTENKEVSHILSWPLAKAPYLTCNDLIAAHFHRPQFSCLSSSVLDRMHMHNVILSTKHPLLVLELPIKQL